MGVASFPGSPPSAIAYDSTRTFDSTRLSPRFSILLGSKVICVRQGGEPGYEATVGVGKWLPCCVYMCSF